MTIHSAGAALGEAHLQAELFAANAFAIMKQQIRAYAIVRCRLAALH
ncbi:MAG: hypothetical protein Q7U66_11840 [Methylobacter sp.]|nr:hypothetical protein [Methylobacter sp.]